MQSIQYLKKRVRLMTLPVNMRRKAILEMLADDAGISASALAAHFGVTAVTIRADLAALEAEGLILRTHGGAMPAFHPKIIERMRQATDSKNAIAKAAARLIEDGDTVMIAAGTTTALIPRFLLGRRDVHIVTNNTLLLSTARTNPQLRITLVGGEFRPAEEGLVGPLTLQVVEQFHVTKAFLGIDGASAQQGYTANSVESADFVRKMADRADQVIVLADASKFGNAGFARILPFSATHTLITDTLPSPEFERLLNDAKVTIIETRKEKKS